MGEVGSVNQRREVNDMREITTSELDTQLTELVPARETLFFVYSSKWAGVTAHNSSTALNILTLGSVAASTANQVVAVSQ